MKQRELARVERDESDPDYGCLFVGNVYLGIFPISGAEKMTSNLNREINTYIFDLLKAAAMLKHGLNKERKSGHVKGGGKQVRK